MSQPNIPASVIAQRGKPITLVDGRTVAVCYTFSSLMRLEEQYGSVQGALAEVQKGADGMAFSSVISILAAGLEHESVDDGQRLGDTNVLRYMLDPSLISDYSSAMGAAFEAAFPSKSTADGEGNADADPTQGESSPGQTGTTSAPSHSVEATASSGA